VLEEVETGCVAARGGRTVRGESQSTIKWIQCWQETGSIAAKLSGESISAQEKRNGAALILLACNTETMNLHLAEIAETVAPGSHAVLLTRLAALDSRR
jgi:hypothetical protein